MELNACDYFMNTSMMKNYTELKTKRRNTQYELRSSYPLVHLDMWGTSLSDLDSLANFGRWIPYVSFTLTKSRRSEGDQRFQLAIF